MTRRYSSTSTQTTLATGISSVALSMTVATGKAAELLGGVALSAGYVDQFTVAIDPDTVNEEIVFITQVSGDTFTIVRGRAGTSPISHSGGALVKHVLTSNDLDYYTTSADSASGAIAKSTVTAKGDLLAATANATVARLGIGINDQVLTADATTATGIKWAAPAVPTLDVTFNAQTGTTYTIVLADKNKLVTLNNAAAITLTIPSGIFTVGQVVNIQQIGVGQVTVVSNGTSVITSTGATPGSPKLRTRYAAATILCTSSNNFTVLGDIS